MAGAAALVCLICVAGPTWLACSGEQAKPALRHVSQPEALALMESDARPLFLDVRTPDEYESGHVPGAVLIPYTELPSRLDEVKAQRERLIVVYCESGKRAAIALDTLQDAGLEHLAVLDGHMRGWRDAALPTEN
jgi:rhodanese-related sulfurtransferase